MTFEPETKVIITAPYDPFYGVPGRIVKSLGEGLMGPMYRVTLTGYESDFLFYEKEFRVDTTPEATLALLREKIETKIEEFKEAIPDYYIHHRDEAGYEETYIIRGLQLALDIINEEG